MALRRVVNLISSTFRFTDFSIRPGEEKHKFQRTVLWSQPATLLTAAFLLPALPCQPCLFRSDSCGFLRETQEQGISCSSIDAAATLSFNNWYLPGESSRQKKGKKDMFIYRSFPLNFFFCNGGERYRRKGLFLLKKNNIV